MRRATILIAAAAVACLLTPQVASAAKTTSQTASNGNVSATLSWRGHDPLVSHMHLTISQSGKVAYSQPVSSSDCADLCGPGGVSGKSVQVLDLDGNGELEVVLELYSQGAHCCFIDEVFSPSAALGSYVVTQIDLQNSGAELRDLGHNGQIEFVSADNRFAYTFTDFAESGLPIQILSFSGLAFHDVTKSYPSLIRSDAKLWWHAYTRDHDSGRVGLIAAWAADEYNLGKGKTAKRTLAQQVADHHITSKFVKTLNRFLKRSGYIA